MLLAEEVHGVNRKHITVITRIRVVAVQISVLNVGELLLLLLL